MALNLTIGTFIDVLSIIIVTLQFLVMFHYYSNREHRHVVFLLGVYVSLTASVAFDLVGSLLLLTQMRLVGIFLIPVIGVFTFLFADSFTKDSTDPMKMVVLGILTTIMVFVAMEPDSVYLGTFANGDPGTILSQNLTIVLGLITLTICSVFAYYTPQMHRAATEALKPYTRLCMLSGFMFVVVVPASVLLRISDIIPRFETFLTVCALIPWTVALVKEPRLAFVLPFKVIRLTVFETEGGLPIYSRTWAESGSDSLKAEGLFSGMLQGIGMILTEAVGKGEVREIQLSDAILLLHRSPQFSVACVLIATKSTQTLRHALNTFAEEFYEKFAHEFDKKMVNIRNFDSALELVDRHFGFVPI